MAGRSSQGGVDPQHGKPVDVLLCARADWRWLGDRDDSPWYPGMRLFRQRQAGDWAEVVQRVMTA